MAKFAKVNGDYLPVLNVDTGSYVNSGPNAITTGQTVQPQGPFLAFFTATADTGAYTGSAVGTAIKATEQLSTIHIYEYVNGYAEEASDTLAMAIYPIDAWDASNLQANINAALSNANIAQTVTVSTGASFSAYTYPPTGPIAPAAPVIGTAVATGATTATVQFTPQYDGGSAITSFDVVSVPAGGTGTGLTSPISVTGLTTGTNYVFVATATNAVGTSVPSDPSNQITTP